MTDSTPTSLAGSLPLAGGGGTALTRRGWTVAAIAAVLVVLGATFGDRSLNALVAPAAIGLVVAIVAVHRADRPTVERAPPPDGFPGEAHDVELRVEGDRAGTMTVRDAVPSGVSGWGTEHEVAEGRATVTHRVRYERRGVHELGPATVTVGDLLGLATRTFEYHDETDAVLVYPRLVEPPAHVLASLQAIVELQRRPGRDEFDRLREYHRGDAPRDIHWKSSAKQPDDDLVVKEFLRRSPSEGVRIAVGGSGALPTIDALAEAAASVAIHLLEEGVEVGLETPTASLEPGTGPRQRRDVLAMLARLSSGPPPAGEEGQVRIEPVNGEATVSVGGASVPFDARGEAATGSRVGADGAGADEVGADEVIP